MKKSLILFFLILVACHKTDDTTLVYPSFKIHNKTGNTLENVEMYSVKIQNLTPGASSDWHKFPNENVVKNSPSFSFNVNGVRFLAVLEPDTTVVGDEIFIDSLYFGTYPQPYWSRGSD